MKRAFALTFAALLCACNHGGSTVPSEKLSKYVLDQPPADVGKKLDVSFDGKITLLGARVEAPANLKNKGKVKVTMYWRSDSEVDEDVRLSTHLLDGAGKQIHEIDYVGPLRKRDQQFQQLGPGRWKPGKVYVDEQVFKAPSARSLKTQKFEIAVSLADGEERLPVVRGPHDALNRVEVAELTVTPRPPKPAANAATTPSPAAPTAQAQTAPAGSTPAGSASASAPGLKAPTSNKAPSAQPVPGKPPVAAPAKTASH